MKYAIFSDCVQRHCKTLRNHSFRFPGAASGNAQAVLNAPLGPHCAAEETSQGWFRRRRYEMAETACVTEAQRLGYEGATHVFCGDPGLLV